MWDALGVHHEQNIIGLEQIEIQKMIIFSAPLHRT